MTKEKEIARLRFLRKVQRIKRMRLLAEEKGLSRALWPNEVGAQWYKDIMSSPLFKVKGFDLPPDHSTGKTTRMQLSAYLDARDGARRVIIVDNRHQIFDKLGRLIEWSEHDQIDSSVFRFVVISNPEYLDKLIGCDPRIPIYYDGNPLLKPRLSRIGREWAD